MLMLQDSAAFITNKGVSVIMIFATCLFVAAFMDAYVISPLEDKCYYCTSSMYLCL